MLSEKPTCECCGKELYKEHGASCCINPGCKIGVKSTLLPKETLQNTMKKVVAQRDEILIAFIAKHGCEPDECEQVMQQTMTGPVWFVRKKLIKKSPIKLKPLIGKWDEVPIIRVIAGGFIESF